MTVPPFSFDPSQSSSENIDRFFVHMESIDPAFTKVLKENIGLMLPLKAGTDRAAQRRAFISAILKHLDKAD